MLELCTISYIAQSNGIDEDLRHLHRQIQCSHILSSCQSQATPERDWSWYQNTSSRYQFHNFTIPFGQCLCKCHIDWNKFPSRCQSPDKKCIQLFIHTNYNIMSTYTLFKNARIAVNKMFQRNALKFATFYVWENQCSFFPLS